MTREQPERTEPTKTSSYNISPTGGNPLVSDDLHQRVIEVLQQDSFVDDEMITVKIKGNACVELNGSVPDKRMIERATELVRGLGVAQIDNDLIVKRIN